MFWSAQALARQAARVTHLNYSIVVPWREVRGVLDLLGREAAAAFKPRPVGNRAVIDCELETDAKLILSSCSHARRLKPSR